MTPTNSRRDTNTAAAQNASETGTPKTVPGESENDKAGPPRTRKAPGMAPGALVGYEKRPPLPIGRRTSNCNGTH